MTEFLFHEGPLDGMRLRTSQPLLKHGEIVWSSSGLPAGSCYRADDSSLGVLFWTPELPGPEAALGWVQDCGGNCGHDPSPN